MKYGNPVRWSQMARTLKIFGFMKDDGKAEAKRISELLKKRIAEGKAQKLDRGLYRQIKSE